MDERLDRQLEEGMRLHSVGELEGAERIYRRVLEESSEDVDALHLLGVLLGQKGENQAGLELIDRSINGDPECAEFWNNRGMVVAKLGRVEEAMEGHRKAIELRADFAEAYNSLGVLLLREQRAEEAAEAFGKAVAAREDFAGAYSNLGAALNRIDKYPQAMAACGRAVELNPKLAEAQINLGVALHETGRDEEAISAYRKAIELDGKLADAHANLGAVMQSLGRHEEAMAEIRRAIEINPRSAAAHYNLALGLLGAGDYLRGFEEYEWRAHALGARQKYSFPQWEGQEITGKRILLHDEGGVGDAIQFVRYVPLVARMGAEVTLRVRRELGRLFSGIGVKVVLEGEELGAFDFHASLLSLPRAFGTTVETVPREVYLRAEGEIERKWREAMGAKKGLRVGVVWAGSARHRNDRNRSMPVKELAPLIGIEGIMWVSLQKGRAGEAARMGMVDRTEELSDFAETAGLIANLDAVISVDTAVAHLAGAMGKRTFLMVPKEGDWRWMRGRENSPWYRSVRVIRQKVAGDWGGVVREIVASCELRVASKGE
jgi:tetratricopeptide (TPR) repeat protein